MVHFFNIMTAKEKKQLTYLGGIAVAGTIAYYLFFNKDTGGSQLDPTGNGNLPNAGGATTAVFDATRVAKALYDAMKETGTEETDILAILKNVNQIQFGQVVTKFGRKSYNSVTGNQYTFTPWGTLPLVGLKDWLKSELSASDYNILRLKYPNFL